MVSRLLALPEGQAQLLCPPAALLSVRLSLGNGPAKVENALPQCTLLSLQQLRRGQGGPAQGPPTLKYQCGGAVLLGVLALRGAW